MADMNVSIPGQLVKITLKVPRDLRTQLLAEAEERGLLLQDVVHERLRAPAPVARPLPPENDNPEAPNPPTTPGEAWNPAPGLSKAEQSGRAAREARKRR